MRPYKGQQWSPPPVIEDKVPQIHHQPGLCHRVFLPWLRQEYFLFKRQSNPLEKIVGHSFTYATVLSQTITDRNAPNNRKP